MQEDAFESSEGNGETEPKGWYPPKFAVEYFERFLSIGRVGRDEIPAAPGSPRFGRCRLSGMSPTAISITSVKTPFLSDFLKSRRRLYFIISINYANTN
jgi:hypothetical protein